VRARRLVAGLLTAMLLTGCAQSVDPIERLGKKAAQKVRRSHGTGADSHGPGADSHGSGVDVHGPGVVDSHGPGVDWHGPGVDWHGSGVDVHGPGVDSNGPGAGSYRRWGLSAPLAPAPRPARSARRLSRAAGPGAGVPPVVDRVRTRDRVVFLTYDFPAYREGAERDPRFVDMVRELRLPVSLFVTDSVVGPAYADVARLRAAGASVQHHTRDHTALRGLPYAGQRAEICREQDRLKARFGLRPRLFRPPYGAYDRTTLRAAGDCGVAAVVLWRASKSKGAGDERLRPGDIVLACPERRGGASLTETTARLLRRVQAQGLTVGRLEDYL